MKKQKILISILIINFNNASLLSRAINSCLIQSYSNIEILVFDDKSSDNSKLILNNYKKNKKIKIFFNNKVKKNIAALDAMNGYITLFKKSKGSILFLLDSDDYFKKTKINQVLKIFKKKKNIKFIQDLPFIKNNTFLKKKKNTNNPLSFWPYLAPESCISFRKEFMTEFLKINKKHINEFKDIWLGFRMGVYAFFYSRSFYTLNKNLTFYESLGQSKQYKFLNSNWIKRRLNSFKFLETILKNKINLYKNFDYFITKLLANFF
jgi:glycosyltransferase involved in cell wall biosynthesis